MYIRVFALVISSVLFAWSGSMKAAEKTESTPELFYDFKNSANDIILNKSGYYSDINLRSNNDRKVQIKGGAIHFIQDSSAQSTKAPANLIGTIKRSNSLSLELWFKPTNLTQKGPARIFSLSGGTSDRNLTIGQEGRALQVRIRTTKTSNNGLPAMESTPLLKNQITHAFYTFGENEAKLYINGKLIRRKRIEGNLSNWESDYLFFIGNESTGNRPWLGSIYSLAFYKNVIGKDEIIRKFNSGISQNNKTITKSKSDHYRFFEQQVAPIFANHCLECHDSSNSKGDLNLSRKVTAFREDSIIVKGKSKESLLWESIFKDEMPKKRPALSSAEKKIIKEWIDNGAHWSLEEIDPAVYVHKSSINTNLARRLTVDEYISTVRSTFDVDISEEARKQLPADLRADGFSNTSYNLNVDLEHIQAYSRLASQIVEKIDIKSFSKRFTNNQSFTDKSMANFLQSMGHWVLRGPLDDDELVIYRGITTSAVAGGTSYYNSVKLVLEAMLQSPRFIYRIESQNSGEIVTDDELAVRLSYLVWGSSPDIQLHEKAKQRNLNKPEIIKEQIARMLKDPKAVDQSIQFLRQWLNLNQLSNLRPDKKHFPTWKPQLAEDMKSETINFFKELVWNQGRPLPELFNAQFTYLTPALASHYGITPKKEDGLARYDLESIPSRGGLLTQGSTLTMGGDEASMVTRGLFILNDILRGVVKDPPPCVDTTPVPSEPGLSQRIIAERRIANASCGGCHSRFEPLAFGLERFDGLGTYKEIDNFKNTLRDDGELLIPGKTNAIEFKSAEELMDIMAKSDRVLKTLVWKIVQFAMGRPLGADDVSHVDKIFKEAQNKGGRYSDVITAIAMSELMYQKKIQD
ncbi:MAG: DUF1592 domain-containing protein [Verrucomicrobiales bacterium]